MVKSSPVSSQLCFPVCSKKTVARALARLQDRMECNADRSPAHALHHPANPHPARPDGAHRLAAARAPARQRP